MTVTTPTSRITVREATPDDLPDVTALLSMRDEKRHTAEHVGEYLWQLDPTCTQTWLAMAGKRPVGITMLYLRDMAWPDAEDPTSTVRAGYWAHLFVDPEFRKQMVYPQLVLAMLRGVKSAGIDVIYTGTRQPLVAEGHQKLGFALVGKLPVRLRPLRPFRLLAKHKGAGGLAALARPFDAVYGLFSHARRRQSPTVETIDLVSEASRIAELLDVRASGSVHQRWTAEVVERRFAITLDGKPYRVTGVRQDGEVTAVAIATLAVRGDDIRAAVILELAADNDAPPDALHALLVDIEQFAIESDAELALALPSTMSDERATKMARKYLATQSEEYHLLVYPKDSAAGEQQAAELANWHFTFGDHDAF